MATPSKSGQIALIEVPVFSRIVGTVIAVTVIGALVAGRAIPFFLAALFLVTVAYAIIGARTGRAWIVLDPATTAFLALLGFAALSSLWALAPLDALGHIVLAAVVLLGSHVIIGRLAQETADRSAFLAYWFVIGYVAGLAYLTTEVLSGQSIKIWLFNTFTFIEPTNQGYYHRSEGRIYSISAHDLNRSLAAMTLLLWPALLCVNWLWSGLRKAFLVGGLLAATAAATYASIHQTSMVAFPAGIIIFGLAYYWLAPTRKLVALAWGFGVFAIIPAVFLVFHLDLHRADWVPFTGQSRIVIWRHTADETLKSPWIGVGARSTYNISPQVRRSAKRLPDHRQPLTTGRHAHNIYLQTWFELGVIGAILLFISGFMLLRRIQGYEVVAQPYALAAFAQAMIIGALTWGMWQTWYLALFALAAIFFSLAVALTRHAQSVLQSGTRREFVREIRMWNRWGYIGGIVVAIAMGIVVTLIALDDGDQKRSGKPADVLLGELTACRKDKKKPGCTDSTGDLVVAIVKGHYSDVIIHGSDSRFFEMSGKSRFGAYMRKAPLISVKDKCTAADTKVDRFCATSIRRI